MMSRIFYLLRQDAVGYVMPYYNHIVSSGGRFDFWRKAAVLVE